MAVTKGGIWKDENNNEYPIEIGADAENVTVNGETLTKVIDDIKANKLERKVVSKLPSETVLYDFEDGKAVFTVPSINSTVKDTSNVIEYEGGNGYYQSITTSGTVGSTNSVYSQLDFSSISGDADDIIVEFDFQYVQNGRFRIALADLDVLNALSNVDVRWNQTGIAADIFSNSGDVFQINRSGSVHPTFF